MKYKILKPEIIAKNGKLLNEYSLIKSIVDPNQICHLMYFGNEEEVTFNFQSNFVAKFNIKTAILEIKCLSSGGLLEIDLKKYNPNDLTLSKTDKKCANYAFEFIEKLEKEKIIEKHGGM